MHVCLSVTSQRTHPCSGILQMSSRWRRGRGDYQHEQLPEFVHQPIEGQKIFLHSSRMWSQFQWMQWSCHQASWIIHANFLSCCSKHSWPSLGILSNKSGVYFSQQTASFLHFHCKNIQSIDPAPSVSWNTRILHYLCRQNQLVLTGIHNILLR